MKPITVRVRVGVRVRVRVCKATEKKNYKDTGRGEKQSNVWKIWSGDERDYLTFSPLKTQKKV